MKVRLERESPFKNRSGLAALGQHKLFPGLFCCCPLDLTCPLRRRNRPADGRAPDRLRSALRLFPHTTHQLLALRVAPAPSGTATRCSASRQKHGGERETGCSGARPIPSETEHHLMNTKTM